jgi:hypothetical protein
VADRLSAGLTGAFIFCFLPLLPVFWPYFLVLEKDFFVAFPVFLRFIPPTWKQIIACIPFHLVPPAYEPVGFVDVQESIVAATFRAVSKFAGFRELKDKSCTHSQVPFESWSQFPSGKWV